MRAFTSALLAAVMGSQVAFAATPGPLKNASAAHKRPIDAATTNPLSPAEALRAFRVPADLEVEQVLAEPNVRQPLFVDWDERGRMWVVEYLQYPYPAGLKMVSHDEYWRAVYDKVPRLRRISVRGQDKITIHEDTDGDGLYDKHKTFVDGLNIVTSFAMARAACGCSIRRISVLSRSQHDDVPDGDPEVHLQGFGLEDTHSVRQQPAMGPRRLALRLPRGARSPATSLARASTSKEPVHSMGQLIWRYHPETRRYEIFAEGGGNAFGVEIDSKGRIFSGHNGGDTRGFHYVQGGYYLRRASTSTGRCRTPTLLAISPR